MIAPQDILRRRIRHRALEQVDQGRIRTLTPRQTIDAGTRSNFASPQCANRVYDNPAANTGLVRVFTPQQNLARLKISGVDAELDLGPNFVGVASDAFRASHPEHALQWAFFFATTPFSSFGLHLAVARSLRRSAM